MDKIDWRNYPVGLPSYSPALDDGRLCQKELTSTPTSWRSEKYPAASRVLVLDHDRGVGKKQLCDDETLHKLLVGPQPQIRFILLESTPHEKVLHRIHTNAAAVSVIKANALADEKTEAHVEDEVADELNISLDSLLKVLARYDFPPSACSHIRGQEQIFGSRVGRDDKKNKVTAFDFWYAIRARAYIRAVDKEADLKMTIVTHYDVKSQSSVILLKHRSFNDLPKALKDELHDKLVDFILNPSTAALAGNPFALHLLHFNSTIQYYRRAARDPRDSVRKEEIKAHGGSSGLEEINIQRLHLTLTSLDQDKLQLNFILGVLARLRKQHDQFYRMVKGAPDVDSRDWLYTRVEEEYDRFENQITYFKTSIEDVAARAQRLLDLLFNLSTRHSTHFSSRMAEEAMKESASMSTIAIMTMVFLPGTFVAGFLGTNLVSGPGQADGSSTKTGNSTTITISSQWWIFPAATIPLTLLTFLLWYLWKVYAERMVNKRILKDKRMQGEV
ncbi:hypothetical protein H112_04656 [Trichophyton rubrum D6]|uniref:CorA family metal ion transporter n=3 Tax=Trichophyton rubrum TaxID=5551 RepID=A0A178F5C0_TRIRU|nr:hypothetical protein H100_04664 [Trichophyton rubrum MR850]EZF41329.1 hypothetical protein H102_04652 [Trichophyton rubrum CBS 100081]EZF52251.1 hypothetical protein H103_04658 [Trichophyton rubrum CBS 288.86]EZF62743.1 hypothetical protein H104_04644 [Trichophyton rubrum CBS 289.86]EZF84056.1 hypothetical protein H110_04653 [Trichophyton rubrum MR1448]EZF94702.1 hypothetical protein H113_04692 [Trichophyton rubrum MR1459]EZG06005.1 hypothetical protein H106_04478 [Trichophyton rubrum CBS 